MKTILIKSTYFIALLAGAIALGKGADYAWAYTYSRGEQLYADAISKLAKVESIEKYIPRADVSLDFAIEAASHKHKVSAVALKALAEVESSQGKYLYRHEPHLEARIKGVPAAEVRPLASSHGPMHVLGLNSETECGIHWSKLYDTMLGVDCGAKILSKLLAKHSNAKDRGKQYWLAFKSYNGTGEAAERHADKVMSAAARLMFEGAK